MKKVISCIIAMFFITTIGAAAQTFDLEIIPDDENILPVLLEDELDQQQTECEGALPVGFYESFANGAIIIAQSFKPSLRILTKIELYMAKNITTAHPCYLSIRENIDGANLITTSVLPTDVEHVYNPLHPCENLSWVEFNFEDFYLNIGQQYYMVIYTLNQTDNYYWVAGSEGDHYPYGNVSFKLEGQTDWYHIDDADGCFKTYGKNNNPPNTPSKPLGPTSGQTGEWYLYSSVGTDPDSDPLKYGWDINGDNNVDIWSDYKSSGTPSYLYVRWWIPGTYNMKVKTEDIYGAQSSWSEPLTVIISKANNPPATPSKPLGPTIARIDTSYLYTTNATDPDSDNIRYGWDWNGDGTVDEWTGYFPSGTTISRTHIWSEPGVYHIKVIAEDIHGKQSDFSEPLEVTITDNNPPNKPERPIGPASGRVGISYTYSTNTTDPDGDNIYYMFDWGDGTDSGWIGPYNSGDTVTVSNIWQNRGTFPVKVKASDIYGAESVWSESLPITMPKSRTFNPLLDSILARLLDNHPIIRALLKL